MKTQTNRTLLLTVTAIFLIAAAVAPLMAHHSFAAFNMSDEKTITGTLKQLEWTNPHIWIWIDVPNAKGGKDTYGFEGMSPNFLERRGWTRTTVKLNDKLTVTFHPFREAGKNPGGMFVTGKMENGKTLTMSGGN